MEAVTPIPQQTHEVIEQIPHESVRRNLVEGLVKVEFLDNHEAHGTPEFEPKFLGDSERVQAHMHDVATAVHTAHELVSAGEDIADYRIANTIWQRTFDVLVDSAAHAKAKGDAEGARQLLVSGLVSEGIYSPGEGQGTGDIARRAVEQGLAEDLIVAAQESRGLVSAEPVYNEFGMTEPEVRVTPVVSVLSHKMPVLEVALGRGFDVEGVYVVVGEELDSQARLQIAESLDFNDISAAAISETVAAEPALQEALVEKSVSILADWDHQVENASVQITKLVSSRPEMFESERLDSTFAEIRSRRKTNSRYRGNDSGVYGVDKCIIELWASGQRNLAGRMLTVGNEAGTDGAYLDFAALSTTLDRATAENTLVEIGAAVGARRDRLVSMIDQENDTLSVAQASGDREATSVAQLLRSGRVLSTADPETYFRLIVSNKDNLSEMLSRDPSVMDSIEGAFRSEVNDGLVIATLLDQVTVRDLLTTDQKAKSMQKIFSQSPHLFTKVYELLGDDTIADVFGQDYWETTEDTTRALWALGYSHARPHELVEAFGAEGVQDSIKSLPQAFRGDIMLGLIDHPGQAESVKSIIDTEGLADFMNEYADEPWAKKLLDTALAYGPEKAKYIIEAASATELQQILHNATLAGLVMNQVIGAEPGTEKVLIRRIAERLSVPRELWKDLYEFSTDLANIDPGQSSGNIQEFKIFPKVELDGLSRDGNFIDHIRGFTVKDFGEMTIREKKGLVIEGSMTDDQLEAATSIVFDMLTPNAKRQMYAFMLHETVEQTRSPGAKQLADKRNRYSLQEGAIPFKAGDFVHASSFAVLGNFLQDGNMAGESRKEFSSTDAFPFNVDMSVVQEVKATAGETASTLISDHYGDMFLVYSRSSESWMDGQTSSPGGREGRHELILGGIPSTEITGLVLRGANEAQIQSVKRTVAENGFYIPVYDTDNQLLLTVEEYDEIRSSYNLDVEVETTIDNSLRTDTQLGSNDGSEYFIPTESGVLKRQYIKFGGQRSLENQDINGTDHVWTEYLGDELYRAAGLAVPNTRMVKIEGRIGKASEWLDSEEGSLPAAEIGTLEGGFVMDAWLGNWDIVRNQENIKTVDGVTYRLDNGNVLDIRAQGDRKPDGLWTDEVPELNSGEGLDMLGNGMRHMYPRLTRDNFISQVQVLRNRFGDSAIDEHVDRTRRSSLDRQNLKRTLKARRDFIVSQATRIAGELG